jgi:hypothetical protein
MEPFHAADQPCTEKMLVLIAASIKFKPSYEYFIVAVPLPIDTHIDPFQKTSPP